MKKGMWKVVGQGIKKKKKTLKKAGNTGLKEDRWQSRNNLMAKRMKGKKCKIDIRSHSSRWRQLTGSCHFTAPPYWDCPVSAVQGPAPSPPTATRPSHPGHTLQGRCPLVLYAQEGQKHTLSALYAFAGTLPLKGTKPKIWISVSKYLFIINK